MVGTDNARQELLDRSRSGRRRLILGRDIPTPTQAVAILRAPSILALAQAAGRGNAG